MVLISMQRAFLMRVLLHISSQMTQSCTNQTQFEYDDKHIDKRYNKLLI